MATTFNPNSNKVFIGGLHPETTEEVLQSYFERFGEIYECVLMHDKFTGKSKGFAFVIFKDTEVVSTVLNKKHFLDGKELLCRHAISSDSNTSGDQNANDRENLGASMSESRTSTNKEANENEVRRRENKNTTEGQKTSSEEKKEESVDYYSSATGLAPKLEGLYNIGLEFLYGIRDSLELKKVLEFILISKTIKKLFVKTVMINGVLIFGSAAFLKLFVNTSSIFSLDRSEIVQTIFSILYHLLYLYPLYLFSFIVNTFDYSDISTEALTLEGKLFKNRGVTTPDADIVTRIYNEVINALILLFFIIQAFAISFIPWAGPILYIVTQSFMYAFYCFTYKWGTDQGDLFKILAFFEKHFFYFAGFGFVYAFITRLFPGVMGGGIYAALFPIFLLLSVKATPPKDLEIHTYEQFKDHVKLMFKKKQLRPTIEYDYISTFNYQEICQTFKQKWGIFTFPMMGINFVGSYLNKKVKL